jgi:predicted MFS family arabinose efflux permease
MSSEPKVSGSHYQQLLVLLLLRCRGRRTAGLAYAVIYSMSCVTKHSPNFMVLMVGRVLGGIATSLLYSAFESWLVAEHFKHGFSGRVLSTTGLWATVVWACGVGV